VGFELPSLARSEPTAAVTQDSSFARTLPPGPNEVDPLRPAVEVMSEGEWMAELDKLGSA